MTETAPASTYYPSAAQLRPLVVLGVTPGLRAALDAADVRYVAVGDPEQAATVVDLEPLAVLGYGPDVFGRALSARPTRVERCDETAEPLLSLILIDGTPTPLPNGEVDDDARRLMHKARVPLRCAAWADVTDPEHLGVLRRLLAE